MPEIFKLEAPKYWENNLPVIPLVANEKRPAINGWQLFADRQPTEDEKAAWLSLFPDGNIGLPMGPASGLVAIDIDTEDPKVLAVLDRILPKSPWNRVGRKGSVKVFRYNGERTTRIKHADGSMICEILSKGTQFVLPPSIHPDTGKAYTSNVPLLDVVAVVPSLPVGFEDLIRASLKEVGIEISVGSSNKVTNFVPAGARDNTMVWHAGLLARAVTRGERTLLQALGEMRSWVENYVEQVIGDPLSVEKAQQKVVEFLVRDVTGERRMALPVGWDEGLTDEDREKMGLNFTEDHECWDAARIRQYLAVEFEKWPDPQSDERTSAVEAALARMAQPNTKLSNIDEERILRYIASQSSKTIGLVALRADLKQLRRGPDILGENHNEITDALKERLDQFGEMRFHAGSFWQWKGAQWTKRDEAELVTTVATDFGDLPTSSRHGDYTSIVRLLRNKAAKPLQETQLSGINFANGYLTKQSELIPHDPAYGCTYVLPYCYRADIAWNTPMFSQFLLDCWGHDADFAQKVASLQEMIGAILFQAATDYQQAFCLIGVAASGKSVLADVIEGLLPTDSVCNVGPEAWGDTFLPAQMFGKVLNRAGELSERKSINGDIFKQIVSGEAIEAQYKHCQPFRFHPRSAQLFCSNHHPKSRDHSNGFSRRWLFLSFSKAVEPAKRDVDLAKKILSEEREAIAAWAVEGFQRLQKQGGYTLPESHHANVDLMTGTNNPVYRFLKTSTKVQLDSVASSTSSTILHAEYSCWRIFDGCRDVARSDFEERMRELASNFGFAVETKEGEIHYRGIALKAK